MISIDWWVLANLVLVLIILPGGDVFKRVKKKERNFGLVVWGLKYWGPY